MAKKQLVACLRLMRPINSLMVGFAVIVGVFLATSGRIVELDLLSILSGFTVGFAISASSMVLNDIADIEIDRVNAPHRPLPSGMISVRSAILCYWLLLAVGLSLSTMTGIDSLVLAALAAVIAALYDLKLKLSGFAGNVAVAFTTSLPFLYAFTMVDEANPSVIVFWGMVFLTVLGREIAKDIADVEGDMVKGARTLPILYGRKTAAAVASLLYLSAILLSPLPYLRGLTRHPIIYLGGVVVVDVILAYSSLELLRMPRKKVALRHKNTVLKAMLLGLIIFMASMV
ncbi:MAG: geranylgeranylglycerol-phosphate geranylgeranyltransferase [Desulfurococcales archaeon]|nr:geranylgeranylglycerol-phosphate geranylgeranyltransferase [Desulfurococcales archaeon]